jgi:hypothetical protein
MKEHSKKNVDETLKELGFMKVRKLDWTGTVRAVTRVKDPDSKIMMVKLSVGNLYLEVGSITDEILFKQLGRIAELEHKVKVTVEEVTE